MNRLGPRTIFQLVALGLVVVAAPLVAGLLVAGYQVGSLAQRGQAALDDTHRLTTVSLRLIEDAVALQRSAAQHAVLGDREVFDLVVARRAALQSTLEELVSLGGDAARADLVAKLRKFEAAAFTDVQAQREAGIFPAPTGTGYPDLAALAQAMLVEASHATAQRSDQLLDRAAEVQDRLWLQSTALIPAAIVLAVLLSFVIARPLRQIDRAIAQLARGRFDAPVLVDGPRDMRELGSRLDALRVRLVELEEQKVNVIRQISHDLKTPLTAIREGTELLTENVVGELTPEQAEVAAILHENGLRLQRLIEDLLQLNVEALAVRSPRVCVVELGAVAERVLDDHKLAATGRDVRVETSLAAAPVRGDPDQLRVLIDNLVSNAVKYCRDGGRLRVRVGRDDDDAVVDVEDDGPGIPAHERERVFEAFYQGQAPEGVLVRSSGLGLAIAQQIASLHEGRIQVVDAPVGAHLRVTFPLAR